MNKKHFLPLTFLLVVLIASNTSAQTKPHRIKVYYAIVDTGSSNHIKTVISGVTDSTLILENLSGYYTFTLSYKKVEQIKIKARGRITRGIVIGAGAGLVLGLIVGSAAAPAPVDTTGLFGAFGTVYNSISTTAAVTEGGLIGLIGGSAAGALIGSIPNEKIEVNRDQKKFLAAVPLLKMYCPNQ